MTYSPFMKRAREILQTASEKKLSAEKRRELAVELATVALKESQRICTPYEKKVQDQLANMMEETYGKVFTTAITDQCFRSSSSKRWRLSSDRPSSPETRVSKWRACTTSD